MLEIYLTKNYYGIFNVDLEKRSIESGDASIEPDNYYPKEYLANYKSIVSPTENANINSNTTDVSKNLYAYNGNIYKYMQNNAKEEVATAYFTALGRERNSTYKINEPYRLPDGLKFYEGNSHRYYKFDSKDVLKKDSITWNEAEAYCESLGGHLVTINTSGEENFINNNLSNSKIFVGATKKNNWITNETTTEPTWKDKWIMENNNSTMSSFICEWE